MSDYNDYPNGEEQGNIDDVSRGGCLIRFPEMAHRLEGFSLACIALIASLIA
jgi:hypothetical protein